MSDGRLIRCGCAQSQVSAQLQERHTRKAALSVLHQQEDIDESVRNTAATLRELEVLELL